jgi:glycosyltransferase involved in cell wall biosynthesis
MREHARRLGLGDRVEFPGRLEGEPLRTAVRRFRVSVLASKTEGLPNTVLESMAAGRPVVATAVGGTAEAMEDGVTGFLVPPGEPAVLAERIVRLLADPVLAGAAGERARQRVAREFTIDRMARQYGALYGALLTGRRGGDR